MMTDTIDVPAADSPVTAASGPMVLAWSDSLAVGPPAIDREHRALLELFRRLADPLDPDATCSERRRALVDDVVRLATLHWDHEEEIMRRSHYPDFAAHRQAHDDLLEQVNHFLTLMNDTVLPAASLSDFVGGWLLAHILHDDKALGVWLAANPGVSAA